ncbi:MAG: hypothetical protein ACR2J4_11195, partial [Deinococcus sp.]
PWSRAGYNWLREGYAAPPGPEIYALARELQAISGFDPGWLDSTVSEQVLESFERQGAAASYRELDGAYRSGALTDLGTPHARPGRWQGVAGFAAYYLPKLPYMARKVQAEHHAQWEGGELEIGEVGDVGSRE